MVRRKRIWKPPTVIITWIDACGFESLHGTKGHVMDRAKLVTRETVGYLIDADDKRTVLAHDYDAPDLQEDEPEIGNITVIPSGWVLKVRYITRKRKENRVDAKDSNGNEDNAKDGKDLHAKDGQP